MDLVFALVIGLLVGAVLGAVIGVLVVRGRRASTVADADPAVLEARHQVIVAELRSQESAARAEVSAQLAAAEAWGGT